MMYVRSANMQLYQYTWCLYCTLYNVAGFYWEYMRVIYSQVNKNLLWCTDSQLSVHLVFL